MLYLAANNGVDLSKAQLEGLFARDRGLRLPLSSRWTNVTVSERLLRNLVTVLIFLFLASLGTALVLQLANNRKAHISDHKKTSMLYLQIARSEERRVGKEC